jgi:type VI secretion system secreted protein VgrG
MASRPRASKVVEQPAGFAASGSATAYDPIIGAARARAAYNVDGTGMTVAVIDTGVDYKNQAFGGGFGPGAKVVAGYDFGDNSTNPLASSSQHGTAIAGLIGSADPQDLGVAPGVKIVALRVTDNTDTASLDSVAAALQWVVDNRAAYHITAVNMSLSDGGNYAQNWFAGDGGSGQRVTDLIDQLAGMNIPVIAATGNSFNGRQGEGFAAIASDAISVTATDLSGALLPGAQRLGPAIGGASATTIAAPGDGLTAPMGDAGSATVEGTSFATALVTGGVTLLQGIYQSRFGVLPSIQDLKGWLQEGSTPIYDPVTGITIGQLNVLKAAALIPAAQPAPTAPPSSSPVISPAPNPTPAAPTVPTAQVPIAAPARVTPVPVPAAPAAPSPVSSPTVRVLPTTPAPAPTTSVQVFMNGVQIDPAGPVSTRSLGALNRSSFAALLRAMSAWAWGGGSDSGQAATQVQVWNA